MEMEHSFTVPLPEERTWDVLLDVERVATCMPGATLDAVDGDMIKGRMKIKVGPIAMTYAGTARFSERDPDAHVITLEASGKETRGAGTASATIRSALDGRDGETQVTVSTTLNVTGRPAQFGRGVMAEVGGKLIGIFATNLADMLSAIQEQPGAGGDEGQAPAAAEGASAGTAAAGEDTGTAGQGSTAGAAGGGAGGAPAAGTAALADPQQGIEVLNLPVRSYSGLRSAGIGTLADLTVRTGEDLLAIGSLSPAAVEEIRQKLAGQGLTLSDSPATSNGLPTAGHPVSTDGNSAPAAAAAAPPAGQAPPQDPGPGRSSDEALDLLGVAGMPVLKRALPLAAALVAAAAVAVGVRFRSKLRGRHGSRG